jgi:hypothetical protein
MPISSFPLHLRIYLEPLNGPSYMRTVITEHRLHGSASISLACFTLLAEAVDTYDGAM